MSGDSAMAELDSALQWLSNDLSGRVASLLASTVRLAPIAIAHVVLDFSFVVTADGAADIFDALVDAGESDDEDLADQQAHAAVIMENVFKDNQQAFWEVINEMVEADSVVLRSALSTLFDGILNKHSRYLAEQINILSPSMTPSSPVHEQGVVLPINRRPASEDDETSLGALNQRSDSEQRGDLRASLAGQVEDLPPSMSPSSPEPSTTPVHEGGLVPPTRHRSA